MAGSITNIGKIPELRKRIFFSLIILLVYRLGILPMVLFSGAFFPISQLPTAIMWLAYLTPIWHGVDLARGLTTGTATWLPALGHIAYLLVWFLVGWCLAVTGFARRLSW